MPVQNFEMPPAELPGSRREAERQQRQTADLISMIFDGIQQESPEMRAQLNAMGIAQDEPCTLRLLATARAVIRASKGDLKSFQILTDLEERARRENREVERLKQSLELERKRYELEYEKFHQNDVDNNLTSLQENMQTIADLLRQPVPDRTIEMIENTPDEDETPRVTTKKTTKKKTVSKTKTVSKAKAGKKAQ